MTPIDSRRTPDAHATVWQRLMFATSLVAAMAMVVSFGLAAYAQPFDLDNDGLSDLEDPCTSDPRNFCYGLIAVDSTFNTPVRVNAGAKQNVECSGVRTDCAGHVWYHDFAYNQVARTAVCDLFGGAESCVISGVDALFGCSDENTQDLFQCEHFDRPTVPDLAYSFAVENGDYVLNLFFANSFTSTAEPGTRLFDVLVEGEVVLDDFDQVAAAGGNGIAVVRSFLVTVADGTLDLEFGHVLQNPAIKAIELLRRVPCLTQQDCEDGDQCNGVETCQALFCASGTPVACNPDDEVCETGTGICREKGGPCEDDGDCVGGEVCNSLTDLCQPLGGPCDDDTDCAGAEACNTSAGACQPLGGRCEDDDDCTDGEGCDLVEEDCRARGGVCQEDADCVGGEFCAGTTCSPCSSDDDCTGGGLCLVCIEGACVNTSPCDSVCERCDAGACTSLCANPFQAATTGTTSGDALFALRSAIGLQGCAPCVCDASGDGQVTAPDALGILRFAIGLSAALECPAPTTTTLPPTTTTSPPTTTTVPQTTTTLSPTTTTVPPDTTTTTSGATTTTTL